MGETITLHQASYFFVNKTNISIYYNMVHIILPTLNQTAILGTIATFIGAGAPEEIGNATTLTGSIDTAATGALFKFYTTPNVGDTNVPATTSDVTHSNWTALAKVATADIFIAPLELGGPWTPGTATDLRTGEHEMVFKLAEAIFGNGEAGDLLSNPAEIMLSFSDSITSCAIAVNNNNSVQATTDLINGLLYTTPQRFAMKYNSVVTGALYTASKFIGLTAIGTGGAIATVDVGMSASGTVSSIIVTGHTSGTFVLDEKVSITDGYGGSDVVITLTLTADQATKLTAGTGDFSTLVTTSASATMGTYTGVIATGTTSTATATVTVLCSSATSVLKLFVSTVSSGTFQKGEQVTFTNGGGSTHNVTIASINSVQVAALNGTLDNILGTDAPLEDGDDLSVMFKVNSHASQTNASGSVVSTTYKARFNFVAA
jgi:hypothetical protein